MISCQPQMPLVGYVSISKYLSTSLIENKGEIESQNGLDNYKLTKTATLLKENIC